MWVHNLVYDYFLSYRLLPTLNYQQHRHGPLDEDKLYELLSKGYPLEQDPEDVFRRLHDEYTAKGKSLPHNYGAFKDQVESFYKSRNQSLPPIVQRAVGKWE